MSEAEDAEWNVDWSCLDEASQKNKPKETQSRVSDIFFLNNIDLNNSVAISSQDIQRIAQQQCSPSSISSSVEYSQNQGNLLKSPKLKDANSFEFPSEAIPNDKNALADEGNTRKVPILSVNTSPGIIGLKSINLSHCRIRRLLPGSLDRVIFLENLNLSSNFLVEIPDFPENLRVYHLKSLNLSKNHILSIGETSLLSLKALRVIDLSFNLIRFLPAVFHKMANLSVFYSDWFAVPKLKKKGNSIFEFDPMDEADFFKVDLKSQTGLGFLELCEKHQFSQLSFYSIYELFSGKKLLANETDLFTWNTILHELAKKNQIGLLRVILEDNDMAHKDLLNAVNFHNKTALITALESGHMLMSKYLLSCGADPKKGQGERGTPAHYAALFKDYSLMKTLQSLGTDLNAPDLRKNNPLHIIMETFERKEPSSVLIAELLLQERCNPNCFNDSGLTPLHLAVIFSQKSALRFALEYNSKHSKDEKGEVCEENFFFVPFSFTKKTKKTNETLVHLALSQNDPEVLVEIDSFLGVEPFYEDSRGQQPFNLMNLKGSRGKKPTCHLIQKKIMMKVEKKHVFNKVNSQNFKKKEVIDLNSVKFIPFFRNVNSSFFLKFKNKTSPFRKHKTLSIKSSGEPIKNEKNELINSQGRVANEFDSILNMNSSINIQEKSNRATKRLLDSGEKQRSPSSGLKVPWRSREVNESREESMSNLENRERFLLQKSKTFIWTTRDRERKKKFSYSRKEKTPFLSLAASELIPLHETRGALSDSVSKALFQNDIVALGMGLGKWKSLILQNNDDPNRLFFCFELRELFFRWVLSFLKNFRMQIKGNRPSSYSFDTILQILEKEPQTFPVLSLISSQTKEIIQCFAGTSMTLQESEGKFITKFIFWFIFDLIEDFQLWSFHNSPPTPSEFISSGKINMYRLADALSLQSLLQGNRSASDSQSKPFRKLESPLPPKHLEDSIVIQKQEIKCPSTNLKNRIYTRNSEKTASNNVFNKNHKLSPT